MGSDNFLNEKFKSLQKFSIPLQQYQWLSCYQYEIFVLYIVASLDTFEKGGNNKGEVNQRGYSQMGGSQ